jgi:NodT family efflux transporter outer membrane factor (OMF) lipoprotein
VLTRNRLQTAELPMSAADQPCQVRVLQRLHARTVITLAVVAAMSGCAAPSRQAPALELPAEWPAQWQAPLPHDGKVAELSNGWQRFDDPLLVRLIAAAQAASPSLANAKSRIEQARASRVGAGAALAPTVSASVGASRGLQDSNQTVLTGTSAGLQMAWEIDLFGAKRAAADAAQARLEGAQALWHDARVAVAAEVANAYTVLRACEAISAQFEIDVASRSDTARLNALSAERGLQALANAALARASAAQGQLNLLQQQAACESQIKALVALTALPEPELRASLATSSARMAQAAAFAPDRVPAQALAQRPDLASAAQDVIAASADVSESQAQRYPRIALAGSISASHLQTGMGRSDGTLWSLGPLQLTLPVFDAGARRANELAARARYDAAVSTYRATLRTAVREVEQALVALHSTAGRAQAAQTAADGFRASFLAVQARQRGGLASLFELEDARRSDAQAQTALIELQRERVLAWIALYRALGGPWDSVDAERTAAPQT